MLYNHLVQRNTDLVRLLLLAIEASSSPDGDLLFLDIPGYAAEEISYHTMLLHKAGLIEAIDLSHMQGSSWKPVRLTWDGHEFIDAIRSDTVWNKTKSFVVEKTGTLSIEAVKLAVPVVIRSLPGL